MFRFGRGMGMPIYKATMNIRLLVAAVLIILALPLPHATGGDLPGGEVSLKETEVKDRFFSYLIGLAEVDTCGMLDATDLSRVLSEFRGQTAIPFETIKNISRECAGPNEPKQVAIRFTDELRTPVPYSILGYHPGSVRASPTVKFYEWDIPRKTLRWNRDESLHLSEIHVFGIYEGWAVVDVDAWLDAVLGDLLDDARIVVLALFKYQGDWHGLAAGYGPSGEGRSGIFNFSQNQILFPTPGNLRILGPYFRNFVTRMNRVEAPLPPFEKWQQTG
jgi:hypothetical protein